MVTETPSSMKTTALRALKRGLLLYWSLWCTVVFAMQAIAGLQALGVIGKGDLPLMSPSHVVFGRAAGERGAWRVAVILWEGATAVIFWLAFHGFHGGKRFYPRALAAAFTLALTLYAIFAIIDKVLWSRSYETTHLTILTALAVSLLIVWFVPE